MTTQEIKDLIASAIAGQGNQVDAGGKLAEVLNAIVENMPTVFTVGAGDITGDDLPAIFSASKIVKDNKEYFPSPFASIAAKYWSNSFGLQDDEGVSFVGVWQTSNLVLDDVGAINTGGMLVLKAEQDFTTGKIEYSFEIIEE